MKRFVALSFIAAMFLSCEGNGRTIDQTERKAVSLSKLALDPDSQVVDTIILSNDTAFLIKNKPIPDDIGDKRKAYLIHISFSNSNWPNLTYKNAIGADLAIIEDLDGDHNPELLLRPEWFSSCWASINLFSLKNREWKLIKKGSMYFCSDQYPLNKRIIKTEKGWGLLTDSLADDKFIILKKDIKF